MRRLAPGWVRDDRTMGLLFLLPGVLVLLLSYVYPLLFSAWLSLSEWNIRQPGAPILFSGLDNYREVLGAAGFWAAAERSLAFTLVALPVQLLLGTAVAVLLTSEALNRHLAAGARVLLLVPLMLPPVVLGILWRLMFNVRYGPLNAVLGAIGIEPLMWIASPSTSMSAVIVVEVIANTSVVAMILIGGLLSLPPEPIRAAQMDGASPWRILFEIRLRQLVSYYLIIILIRVMDLLKTFDFIYAMTFGGPGDSTQVLNLYIFRLGSRFLEYPQAAAASWIFLLLLLPPSLVLLLKAVAPSKDYLND
jgi:multiple sugar transport system permease protein